MSPALLLDFESRFHTAALAALLAEGISPAYSARDLTPDLPPARVVVEAGGFARASGHMAFAADGSPFYDHYTGQLAYTLTTPRTPAGVAVHAAWLGRVRALHQRARQAIAGLPYGIVKMEDTGGSITYIRDGERDRSELLYTVEFGIPGAAMDFSAPAPAVPPVPTV